MCTHVGDEMGLLGGEALWSEEERRMGRGWERETRALVSSKEMHVMGNQKEWAATVAYAQKA